MADARISLMDAARKAAQEEILDGVMFARAELVRPAIGNKRPREDVIAEHDRFVNVPCVAGEHFDELQARFKLSRDKTIPVRFVYLAILAGEELEKERQKRNTQSVLGPQVFDIGGRNGN